MPSTFYQPHVPIPGMQHAPLTYRHTKLGYKSHAYTHTHTLPPSPKKKKLHICTNGSSGCSCCCSSQHPLHDGGVLHMPVHPPANYNPRLHLKRLLWCNAKRLKNKPCIEGRRVMKTRVKRATQITIP